jgi:hypothetical protein
VFFESSLWTGLVERETGLDWIDLEIDSGSRDMREEPKAARWSRERKDESKASSRFRNLKAVILLYFLRSTNDLEQDNVQRKEENMNKIRKTASEEKGTRNNDSFSNQ